MEDDLLNMLRELLGQPKILKRLPATRRIQSFMWTEYMRSRLIHQYKAYNGDVRRMQEEQFPQLQLSQVRNYLTNLRKAGRIE